MAKKIKLTPEQKLTSFLDSVNKELAQAVYEDTLEYLSHSSFSIKGPIIQNPAIQINVSKDLKKISAFLKEKDDLLLEKTYLEIDLMSSNYSKNSKAKKIIEKYKKDLRKLSN